MTIKFIILCFLGSSIYLAQTDITRLSELQKIYFISETNSLTSNFVNPAALSINSGDDGFVFGYDFKETKNQGNSLASLSLGNLGFIYQDIYDVNNMQLTTYALNISVGGSLLSFGTTNKFLQVKYEDHKKTHFLIDAGVIFQPIPLLSIGILANNIGNINIDSIQYDQIYSIGGKLTLIKNTFDIFIQTDFMNSEELNTNVQASVGFSVHPIHFLEFRTWLKGTKDIINEGILTAIFKIENGLYVSASAHFNDKQEQTRYNIMMAVPLQTINF